MCTAILEAPGAVVTTSNKRDTVDATRDPRSQVGEVWIFDPQSIALEQATWWWNPLTYVKVVVLLAVVGVLWASVSIGSRLDSVNPALTRNPLEVVFGLIRGRIVWPPSATWLTVLFGVIVIAIATGVRGAAPLNIEREVLTRAWTELDPVRALRAETTRVAVPHESARLAALDFGAPPTAATAASPTAATGRRPNDKPTTQDRGQDR